MIGNLFFLQACGVDCVSAVCPIKINHFISHHARLWSERRESMRATLKSVNLFNFVMVDLKFGVSDHYFLPWDHVVHLDPALFRHRLSHLRRRSDVNQWGHINIFRGSEKCYWNSQTFIWLTVIIVAVTSIIRAGSAVITVSPVCLFIGAVHALLNPASGP